MESSKSKSRSIKESDSESDNSRSKSKSKSQSKCQCVLTESGGKAKITLTNVPINGLDVTIVGGPCAGHWSIRRTKGKASMERKNQGEPLTPYKVSFKFDSKDPFVYILNIPL